MQLSLRTGLQKCFYLEEAGRVLRQWWREAVLSAEKSGEKSLLKNLVKNPTVTSIRNLVASTESLSTGGTPWGLPGSTGSSMPRPYPECVQNDPMDGRE